jgi:CubicO group peptidase (beta-lactamase class C family)
MRMIRFAVIGCLALFLVATGAAREAAKPQPPAALVDAAVRRQMREQKIPGVSIAVVRGGEILKASGYGLSNLELRVPVRLQTVFPAGSITKQFTATAIMMLVEEGKLALDDHLTTFFPDAPPAWKPITVRHLLTHTSGIPDIFGGTEDSLYTKGVVDFHRDYSEEDLERAFAAQPLDFEPGSRWSYSNAGYQLLGFVIRRVTGQDYATFLRERILLPLGMTQTTIFSYAKVIPNRASGYDLVNGEWMNTAAWPAVSLLNNADGSLLTTPLDLAKWSAALDTERLLKRSSLEAMWKPVDQDDASAYPAGIGWFIGSAHGHRVVFHTGGGFGFNASISRYLDDGITIIVMTNIDESHADVLKIAGDIAAIYLPETSGANPVRDW